MTTLLTSFAQGTHAARPAAAAGNAGRYYYETDTNLLYQSTGSAWTPLATNTAFVASGTGHAAGLVPDPGSSTGLTKFLREDATWQVPAGAAGLASDKKVLTSGNIAITSTTFINISSALAITLTTGAHRVAIGWLCVTQVSMSGFTGQLDVTIDGTRQGQGYGLCGSSYSGNDVLSGVFLSDVLTAASHVFQLQGRVDGGTATFQAGTATQALIFWVQEQSA